MFYVSPIGVEWRRQKKRKGKRSTATVAKARPTPKYGGERKQTVTRSLKTSDSPEENKRERHGKIERKEEKYGHFFN